MEKLKTFNIFFNQIHTVNLYKIFPKYPICKRPTDYWLPFLLYVTKIPKIIYNYLNDIRILLPFYQKKHFVSTAKHAFISFIMVINHLNHVLRHFLVIKCYVNMISSRFRHRYAWLSSIIKFYFIFDIKNTCFYTILSTPFICTFAFSISCMKIKNIDGYLKLVFSP